MAVCTKCSGTGIITVYGKHGQPITMRCQVCNGTGKI